MQSSTFIFFGIVGSGKGTQVRLLQKYLKDKDGLEQVCIGTGDIFRKIMESAGDDDPIKEEVRSLVNAGHLIPDELTNKLVSGVIESELTPTKHLFTDGYPRTIPQSEFFSEIMKSQNRAEIKIIYIELSEEEATKRNMLRGRTDDTPEGLSKRFAEYRDKVIPAMNYFKDKVGYTIYTINGEQGLEDVHKDIIKALGY